MRFIITLFLIPIYSITCAQKNESCIEFFPTFNDIALVINKNYSFKNDSVKISSLKFYISNICFYENKQLVDSVSKKYHLIDIEKPETLSIKFLSSKKIDKVTFNLGIDSSTNISGVFGEDLDPINGMYWTWQSGYINVKLEGKSNIWPSRNNIFNYHIGGYQFPYNSIKVLAFSIQENKRIAFSIDITTLLSELKLNGLFEIMSPSKNALIFAQHFSDAIKVIE